MSAWTVSPDPWLEGPAVYAGEAESLRVLVEAGLPADERGAGMSAAQNAEYAYSGPCVHCGHLPDEHGVGYECLRWDARGWTYTPGVSTPPVRTDGGDQS